jgi:hypothetical protein
LPAAQFQNADRQPLEQGADQRGGENGVLHMEPGEGFANAQIMSQTPMGHALMLFRPCKIQQPVPAKPLCLT